MPQVGKKMADYWEPSTKLLADPTKFLDSLLTFDKDNIPEAVIQKIEPYIGMENFTPEQVRKSGVESGLPLMALGELSVGFGIADLARGQSKIL